MFGVLCAEYPATEWNSVLISVVYNKIRLQQNTPPNIVSKIVNINGI